MTWAGEAGTDGSGLYTFTDDGSPGKLTGIETQIVMWKNNLPIFVDQASLTVFASGAPVSAFAVGASVSFASTIGASYTQIPDMTIVTPPSGTYICFFNSDVNADKSSREMEFAIFAGGVESIQSERRFSSQTANQRGLITTAGAAITLDGTQNIDVRWKSVGATALWTLGGRTLAIFKSVNNV